MTEVYFIENGKVEYKNFYHVLTIAEAKAQEENKPILIFKKLQGYSKPISRVYPTGKREDIKNTK